jgi:hypothetical protein
MQTVEELLKEYRGEVNIAATSFYAWKNINKLAVGDDKIFQALQRNALSWNIFTHSLQITFFTALGRIFDNDNRSFTVRSFINKCQSNVDQFSKVAFEARRLSSANGIRPDYLDDYLAGVYEPVAADFQALADAVGPHETAYKNNYQPIRHKLIAHKDFATIGGKDTLFAKTNIEEIEKILAFLYQIEKFVEQLVLNGRLTELNDHKLNEEDYVRKDLEKLFLKLCP